ncbi:MAG: membrane protein insertion efficiency factor YidD [Deltaproteobacteria bacterium]|nr:membrane protein insertion efficiency factor YidD [Deltaproteobacteria bacterium]
MTARFFLTLFLVTTTFLPLSVEAAGPETVSRSPREPSAGRAGGGESINVGAWLVTLYRDHLSKVDGDRCPSFPSCSSYSVQAFRKHGFIMGWMMTVDRLFHEGSEEKRVSPLVYDHGRLKIYDPVENNDFWWYRPPGEGHE